MSRGLDLDSGGDKKYFSRLKSYIELMSEAEESPAICSGGIRKNISRFSKEVRTKLGIGRNLRSIF